MADSFDWQRQNPYKKQFSAGPQMPQFGGTFTAGPQMPRPAQPPTRTGTPNFGGAMPQPPPQRAPGAPTFPGTPPPGLSGPMGGGIPGPTPFPPRPTPNPAGGGSRLGPVNFGGVQSWGGAQMPQANPYAQMIPAAIDWASFRNDR